MLKAIISIFLLAAAGLIFFTKTQSAFGDLKNLKTQTQYLNDTLEKSKKARSVISDLLGKYNAIPQENISKINKMLPSKPEAIKYIIEMNNLLGSHGLLLEKVDIKEQSKDASAQNAQSRPGPTDSEAINLSMTIKGSYESFKSFARDAEKSLRLFEFKAIKLTPVAASGSASPSGLYNFEVEGQSFWKKDLNP